ncbi:T9SS type A sorting domain-containing protein [Puia sp. P3]|uniref:T9SS type A sorting domain-containing protein n=1 Tax=Puia sp. P3 TaxID=3423952 RepID=UPI003D66EDDC
MWYLTNSTTYPQPYNAPMRSFSGNQFFNAGVNVAPSTDTRTLFQQIKNLPSAFTTQDLTFNLDFYVASNGLFGTDYNLVDVKVEYRDATESNIYVFEYSLIPTAVGPTGWVHVSDTHDILVTDALDHINITLTADNSNTSSPVQAYFDEISLIANAKVLPVTLVDFHALRDGDGSVDLKWETAQEQNSKFMEVQRSGDGKVFTTIGQVAAAGNSTTPRDYTLTDKSPLAGRNYYRLRMVDIDGTFKYSKVLQVAMGDVTEGIGVYGNPFHDQLGVRIPAQSTERLVLSLFDQTGRVCLRQNYTTQKGDNLINLYPQGLAAGVYLLQVRGDRTNQTIRVLKQ